VNFLRLEIFIYFAFSKTNKKTNADSTLYCQPNFNTPLGLKLNLFDLPARLKEKFGLTGITTHLF